MDDETRALAFSPDFQRLRYVRLCNINSLYLTGASEPRRFEHCVGVYHLADLWARARNLSTHEASVVKSAALLHDLLTGPFGHSFQYVMEDNPFEQRFEHSNLAGGVTSLWYQRAHAAGSFAGRPFSVDALLGERRSDVSMAIEGKGPFGPLIAGSLDLDNLDNVVRLAFHMGLCDDDDRAMPRLLAPMLEPFNGSLAAPSDAVPHFERWFEIRRRLYEYLLLDRGEFSAKAMLTLAVERAVEKGLLGPDDWLRTDEGLLDYLEGESVGENQAIGQIVKRLRVGDLFECVDVWRTSHTHLYQRLSEAAAKRRLEEAVRVEMAKAGGPRFRFCIHYILDNKKTCRSLSFRDLDTGEEKVVGHDSKSLLIGAFVTNARANQLTDQERRRISAVLQAQLGIEGLFDLAHVPGPLSETATAGGLFAE
jgi:hypothetical protein